MNKVAIRTSLRRLLPLTLFVLGCFPARGLYFLLHPANPEGRYFSHQPVLSAPTNPVPRMRAAKVPLPGRLTRVPRTLKKVPIVAVPALATLFSFPPADSFLRPADSGPEAVRAQSPPSAPLPSRAPPSAA